MYVSEDLTAVMMHAIHSHVTASKVNLEARPKNLRQYSVEKESNELCNFDFKVV